MAQVQYEPSFAEFADAFGSARAAKNVFWLLLGLAIAAQIVAFCLVDFGGVLDRHKADLNLPPAGKGAGAVPPRTNLILSESRPASGPAVAPTTAPATQAAEPASQPAASQAVSTQPAASQPASTQPASAAAGPRPRGPLSIDKEAEAARNREMWYLVLVWALPTAKFLAVVIAALLTCTLLLAVLMSLVGRLGGAAGFVSAFFWSLILLAMVTPWQQVLNGTWACGALYNLSDLLTQIKLVKPSWDPPTPPTTLDLTLFYARFLAYPAIALLVWLVVQTKFARGYGRMNLSLLAPEPEKRDSSRG